MDNSKKLYVQALNNYNDRNLNKAMELCEKSISSNIKNTSAINLKGLLYYLKGDLNNAQILWKMNAEVNRDSVSKKYLQDSRKDEERQKLYNSALAEIKELRINEALEMLNHCAESDYNVISVNNSISQCYIKKGDYKKAIEHINKVLSIDKKNEEALKNRKAMVEYGMIKRETNLRPIIMGAFALTMAMVIIYFGNIALHKVKNISLNKVQLKQESKPAETKQDTSDAGVQQVKQVQQVSELAFPTEEFKKAVSDNNYNLLYDLVITWNSKDLKINDRTVLNKAEEVLRNQGVEYFYNRGLESLNKNEPSKASVNLVKAYNTGRDSYLYPHIIYLLATSLKNEGDIESALKYYSEYDSKYPKGNYEDVVLYELAILNDIDVKASKNYAKRLVDNFPGSMYNNSKIKAIIEK